MEQMHLDESFIAKKQAEEAAKFDREYGSIISEAAETFNEAYKGNREWTQNDTCALGQYLDQWSTYSEMFNEDLTTRDTLGDYLKVGLGLAAKQSVMTH
jgi:hypothetical protein